MAVWKMEFGPYRLCRCCPKRLGVCRQRISYLSHKATLRWWYWIPVRIRTWWVTDCPCWLLGAHACAVVEAISAVSFRGAVRFAGRESFSSPSVKSARTGVTAFALKILSLVFAAAPSHGGA